MSEEERELYLAELDLCNLVCYHAKELEGLTSCNALEEGINYDKIIDTIQYLETHVLRARDFKKNQETAGE